MNDIKKTLDNITNLFSRLGIESENERLESEFKKLDNINLPQAREPTKYEKFVARIGQEKADQLN